jgi:hypothetical protein
MAPFIGRVLAAICSSQKLAFLNLHIGALRGSARGIFWRSRERTITRYDNLGGIEREVFSALRREAELECADSDRDNLKIHRPAVNEARDHDVYPLIGARSVASAFVRDKSSRESRGHLGVDPQ